MSGLEEGFPILLMDWSISRHDTVNGVSCGFGGNLTVQDGI